MGGGSGGHVTPVLAVINELYKADASLEVYFISDRKFGQQAEKIMSAAPCKVVVKRISAGKLRRYYNVPMWRQLLDVITVAKNVRDTIFVGLGLIQSVYYLLKWRPDVVFTKGGFVCMPVGIAASWFKIPLVIHDSDAHPGLTNRVLAKRASRIATGAPLEFYPYDRNKSTYVGIPVNSAFKPYSVSEQRAAKVSLGFDANKPLVLVTGGGLGARRINEAVAAIIRDLSKVASVLHITGTQNHKLALAAAKANRSYQVVPFIHEGMDRAMGAADIIVTRAGATTLLEIAALGKAAVIIPNAMLTGGHQTKNAAVYAHAAEIIEEDAMVADPELLLRTLTTLIQDDDKRKHLAEEIHALAKPAAAHDTAKLIIDSYKDAQV